MQKRALKALERRVVDMLNVVENISNVKHTDEAQHEHIPNAFNLVEIVEKTR